MINLTLLISGHIAWLNLTDIHTQQMGTGAKFGRPSGEFIILLTENEEVLVFLFD